MKTLQITFGIAIVVLLGIMATKQNIQFFGGSATESYSDSTSSSSTVPITATTTNPILSLDTYRQDATVCFLSGTSTVFLHQKGQATTTGVVKNEGIPLSTSSLSVEDCAKFPNFKGYLYGISASPAVVTVSSHQ